MTSILFISLAISLAIYVIVVKTSRPEPRKARKQEKAEIMRQLLALSDRENNIPAAAIRPTAGRSAGVPPSQLKLVSNPLPIPTPKS